MFTNFFLGFKVQINSNPDHWNNISFSHTYPSLMPLHPPKGLLSSFFPVDSSKMNMEVSNSLHEVAEKVF